MEIQEVLTSYDRLLAQGKNEEAVAYMEQCLSQAIEENDWLIRLGVQNELIGAYRDRSRYADAWASAKDAVEIIGMTGLEETLPGATTYMNVASIYRAEKRYEEAISLYLDVEAIYQKQELADYYCLSGLYNNLSVANLENGNYVGGLLYGERAVELLNMIPGTEGQMGQVYANLAGAALAQTKPDLAQAHKYLDQAEEIYRAKCPGHEGICSVLGNKAYLAKLEGDTQTAIAYYKEAMNEIKARYGENADYQRLAAEIAGLQ